MTYHAANDDSTPAAARAELRTLLDLRAVPFGGLSLEGLDGFLTALAVGPDLVMPGEWLPAIWGAREPRWESEAETRHVYDLLLRFWNDVLRRAALDPIERVGVDDQPILGDQADAAMHGQAWAEGFLMGFDSDSEAWEAWCAQHPWIDDALTDIVALSWQADPEGLVSDGDEPRLELRDRALILATLPGLVNALHRHRVSEDRARMPIRRQAPKIGRNDPCPCGSGRKFKKCCGARESA